MTKLKFKNINFSSNHFSGNATTGLISIAALAIDDSLIDNSTISEGKLAGNIPSSKLLSSDIEDIGSSATSGKLADAAATKAYIDSEIQSKLQGLLWKEPVLAKDGADLSIQQLSGSDLILNGPPLANFDQPNLPVDERLLIADAAGADEKYNGIYKVTQEYTQAQAGIKFIEADSAEYQDEVMEIHIYEDETQSFIVEEFKFQDGADDSAKRLLTGSQDGTAIVVQLAEETAAAQFGELQFQAASFGAGLPETRTSYTGETIVITPAGVAANGDSAITFKFVAGPLANNGDWDAGNSEYQIDLAALASNDAAGMASLIANAASYAITNHFAANNHSIGATGQIQVDGGNADLINVLDKSDAAPTTVRIDFSDDALWRDEAGGAVTSPVTDAGSAAVWTSLGSVDDYAAQLKAAIEANDSAIKDLSSATINYDGAVVGEVRVETSDKAWNIQEPVAASGNYQMIAYADAAMAARFEEYDGSAWVAVDNTFRSLLQDGDALTLQRADDANTEAELINCAVFVSASDEAYTCTSDNIQTLNTSDVEFVKFTGLGMITAGQGLSKTNNTLDIHVGREDDVIALVNDGTNPEVDEHVFSGLNYDQAEWELIRDHSMTAVYSNGLFLKQASAETQVGTDGDYYIKYGNSQNRIVLDTELVIDGDLLSIVFAEPDA